MGLEHIGPSLRKRCGQHQSDHSTRTGLRVSKVHEVRGQPGVAITRLHVASDLVQPLRHVPLFAIARVETGERRDGNCSRFVVGRTGSGFMMAKSRHWGRISTRASTFPSSSLSPRACRCPVPKSRETAKPPRRHIIAPRIQEANMTSTQSPSPNIGICHMPRGEPRRSPPPHTLRGGGLR